jgi:hypothetical protein
MMHRKDALIWSAIVTKQGMGLVRCLFRAMTCPQQELAEWQRSAGEAGIQFK